MHNCLQTEAKSRKKRRKVSYNEMHMKLTWRLKRNKFMIECSMFMLQTTVYNNNFHFFSPFDIELRIKRFQLLVAASHGLKTKT